MQLDSDLRLLPPSLLRVLLVNVLSAGVGRWGMHNHDHKSASASAPQDSDQNAKRGLLDSVLGGLLPTTPLLPSVTLSYHIDQSLDIKDLDDNVCDKYAVQTRFLEHRYHIDQSLDIDDLDDNVCDKYAVQTRFLEHRPNVTKFLPTQHFKPVNCNGYEVRANLIFTRVPTPLRTNIQSMFMKRYSTAVPPSSSLPAAAPPVAIATHKHKVSSSAVAGIVLAIIILLCASIALFWRIRRRRRQSCAQIFDCDAEMNRGGRTISPFTLLVAARSVGNGSGNATGASGELDADADACGISASTIGRQRLETQLRAATKMVELEELAEGTTTSHSNPGNRGGGGGGGEGGEELVSPTGASAAAPPELRSLEAELVAAREQNDILMARINAMDSAWGMGIGGEAPPEYA
ncbi:hypothetical protein MSAN_01098100 [Mycena sanguinolenta]|uniref:Uncharacterized protein n=1 Tax=Mycena sanguinolenta TaxID=230812 RepID=A0A8H7D7L7_9AGAR|nr:hypothetical protein MSAN_01098100 [Mycena sanguinolenta]